MSIVPILSLIMIFSVSNVYSELVFKNASRRIIKWQQKNPEEWLSLESWISEADQKQNFNAWKIQQMENNLEETVGRVLATSGGVQIFRGEEYAFFRPSWRSRLQEGDEIQTSEGGALWLMLMDGTLLRVAPHSSVSLNEINLGVDGIFYHFRVNYGNIFIMARSTDYLKEQDLMETDTIFFPLEFWQAHTSILPVIGEQESLAKFVEMKKNQKNKFRRLNTLIMENNQYFVTKKNHLLLSFANGTIWGDNLTLEVIVLDRNSAYLKLYPPDRYYESSSQEATVAKMFFRGRSNIQEVELATGQWFEINPLGTQLTDFPEGETKFLFHDLITRRIPTLLIARELMMRQYLGAILHGEIDKLQIAKNSGYKLWGSLKEANSDLSERAQFLIQYIRRVETSTILEGQRLARKVELKGGSLEKMEYDQRFYTSSMGSYYSSMKELHPQSFFDRPPMNSTKKKFWSILHGIYE